MFATVIIEERRVAAAAAGCSAAQLWLAAGHARWPQHPLHPHISCGVCVVVLL